MDTYTTHEAAALSGASPRQLDYWLRTGTLGPIERQARGSGHRHRWSLTDVAAAAAIVELSRGGHLPTAQRASVAAAIRATPDARFLVLRGSHAFTVATVAELAEYLAGVPVLGCLRVLALAHNGALVRSA